MKALQLPRPDAAKGFEGHANVGGKVLQRDPLDQFWLSLA